MNPILLGQAQVFHSMRVGDVWCDKQGKIGEIIGETPDAFMLMTDFNVIELVPRAARSLFETTCEWLGPLDSEEEDKK